MLEHHNQPPKLLVTNGKNCDIRVCSKTVKVVYFVIVLICSSSFLFLIIVMDMCSGRYARYAEAKDKTLICFITYITNMTSSLILK